MTSIKGAVNAIADVKVGTTSIGSDGRAMTQLTVTNPTTDMHDYTISVSFTDQSGNLLDATVVTVTGVPPNGTATATAHSNRTLAGNPTAKVTAAVRH